MTTVIYYQNKENPYKFIELHLSQQRKAIYQQERQTHSYKPMLQDEEKGTYGSFKGL